MSGLYQLPGNVRRRDNLFVILLTFESFRIRPAYQHKVGKQLVAAAVCVRCFWVLLVWQRLRRRW